MEPANWHKVESFEKLYLKKIEFESKDTSKIEWSDSFPPWYACFYFEDTFLWAGEMYGKRKGYNI